MRRWTVLGLVVAGLLAVVVGAGLEWGSITVDGREVTSDTGYSGGDGIITVLLGFVAAVGGALTVGLGSRLYVGVTALAAGLLIVLVAVVNIVDLHGRPSELSRRVSGLVSLIESSVGPGLWITLAGGAAIALAGLAGLLWLRPA